MGGISQRGLSLGNSGFIAGDSGEVGSVRPATLGQAARIPGVTPAAIAVLDVYLTASGQT